jgi:hypothetical protein
MKFMTLIQISLLTICSVGYSQDQAGALQNTAAGSTLQLISRVKTDPYDFEIGRRNASANFP